MSTQDWDFKLIGSQSENLHAPLSLGCHSAVLSMCFSGKLGPNGTGKTPWEAGLIWVGAFGQQAHPAWRPTSDVARAKEARAIAAGTSREKENGGAGDGFKGSHVGVHVSLTKRAFVSWTSQRMVGNREPLWVRVGVRVTDPRKAASLNDTEKIFGRDASTSSLPSSLALGPRNHEPLFDLLAGEDGHNGVAVYAAIWPPTRMDSDGPWIESTESRPLRLVIPARGANLEIIFVEIGGPGYRRGRRLCRTTDCSAISETEITANCSQFCTADPQTSQRLRTTMTVKRETVGLRSESSALSSLASLCRNVYILSLPTTSGLWGALDSPRPILPDDIKPFKPIPSLPALGKFQALKPPAPRFQSLVVSESSPPRE
ncbi:hypothetical protein C8R46DRAFT_1186565 [Mycena filopes]|nr:hypothetical protein C8R46DRAFT_1186565 [Mycena filopes]